MGPGTNIAHRILNRDKPVDYLDRLSQQHDLDYLQDETLLADIKAVFKALPIPGLKSTIFKLGLLLRNIIPIHKNGPLSGLTMDETKRIGKYLQMIKDRT